jgi:hypothetical protein
VFSQAWKKLRDTVKRVHAQREPSFDMEFAKAYHMIATSEEVNVQLVEKIYEDATALALREWRSLPDIVSHSHIPILEVSPYRCSGARFKLLNFAFFSSFFLFLSGPHDGILIEAAGVFARPMERLRPPPTVLTHPTYSHALLFIIDSCRWPSDLSSCKSLLTS